METKVIYTEEFEKDVKKFLKKFPTLAEELLVFEESLIENPMQGISLGAGLYKVRVASESKSKGKSGGFRVINYLVTKEKILSRSMLSRFMTNQKKEISKNSY